MYKQLIFDCDGVLVDTEIVAAEVVVKAMNDLGSLITLEEYLRDCTGKLISTLLNTLPEEQTRGVNLEALMERCEKDIYNRLTPVKGMKELVLTLSQPKAVVSNSCLWQVKKAVKHVGLEAVFNEKYFSSEMVANPKPWPDLYLYAAQHLAVSPEECLVIEDSKSGVKSAVAAGMTVIGFTGASHIRDGHKEALMDLGATEVTTSPEELGRTILHLSRV